MSNDDNVIQFPSGKTAKGKVGTKKLTKAAKRRLAEAALSIIMDSTFKQFDDIKFIDKDDESFIRDFVFVTEAIKSCLYRQSDQHHRLHEYVDKHIKVRFIEGLDELGDDEQEIKLREELEKLFAEEKLDDSDT